MKKKNIIIYLVLSGLIAAFMPCKYMIICYLLLLASVRKVKIFILNLYYNLVYFIKHLFSKNKLRLYDKDDRKEKIIVSLTTYSKRIKNVFLAIESIFEQEVKPDKIVLWLDKDEFTIDSLPKTLKKQIKQGLEVDFYHNIKSYKKIVPSLKKYPNDIIITIDDDILYKKDCIKNLYSSYLNNKNAVHCNYLFKFLNEKLLPTAGIKDIKYLFNYIGTGGGALFPPHILPSDILDEELFMKLAPIHDDLFISVLLYEQNTKIINVNKDYLYYTKLIQKRMILNTQSIGLFNENYFKNKTKTQLINLLDHYKITLKEV